MRKIPTLFVRDANWRATEMIAPVCAWVAEGGGVATRKLDGTACLICEEGFFKRYTLKSRALSGITRMVGWRRSRRKTSGSRGNHDY